MTATSDQLLTLEHRWMRAWVAGDSRTLKDMTSRRFRLVVGSAPCVILDYRSWIEAAARDFRCRSYAFGDIYARRNGATAIFATQVAMESSLGGHAWDGPVWMTAVWQRTKIRRNWKIAECILSRVDPDPALPRQMRALQLWR